MGAAWNFKELSYDNVNNTNWLQDFGFELRLFLNHFYRIPSTAYFHIAWPLEDLPTEGVEKYDKRIYFGLRLGGSY